MKGKEIFRTISACAKVFVRGAIRTAYGAATAGLIGLAVYGILAIPGEQGWTAVCDFVATAATIGLALVSIYWQGMNKKRGVR